MDVFALSEGAGPLVVSMPHSGTSIPVELHDSWPQRLTSPASTMPDTDWHIPELYDFLAGLDASVIRANYSRYIIDLNRDPSGQSLYPGQATTGLVPIELFDGAPVYRSGHGPDADEIEQRRQRYHTPYHQALTDQIARVKARHGYALLWDAHSIASLVPRLFEGRLPDLNLGTNAGRSCAPQVQAAAEAAMVAEGNYKTISNGRFKGGWITRHYGQPQEHVHALQMEIAQIAYMQEGAPFQFDEAKAQRLRPVLLSIIQAALSAAQALYAGDTL